MKHLTWILALLALGACTSPTEPNCRTTTAASSAVYADSTITVPVAVTYCVEYRGRLP